MVASRAAPPAKCVHGEVVHVLTEEKRLAEEGAILLHRYAKPNQALCTRGTVLYAQAKAEFDGLIGQLKVDLGEDRWPAQSPRFREALQQAVEHRQAFWDFVLQEVAIPAEAMNGLPVRLAFKPVLDALIGQTINVWREYRNGKSARREDICRELDAQKWLPFDRCLRGRTVRAPSV